MKKSQRNSYALLGCKLGIYSVMVLASIMVCASDKTIAAKALLCMSFAFVLLLWDCLCDCMKMQEKK